MRITRLQVAGLRALSSVDVAPGPRFNFVFGANGSGKTSLLEAIYLLGHGRSFRTRHSRELVQSGREALTVFGETEPSQPVEPRGHRVGLSWERAGSQRVRLDGAGVQSASELARLLPMLVVNADGQRILGDGARERRALLDWLLFHVEPDYHHHLLAYRRALQQRNAALRRSSAEELAVWSNALAGTGERLQSLREARLPDLLAAAARLVEELVAGRIELRLYRGWNETLSLRDMLDEGLTQDREQGRTRFGPHRADLVVRVDGRPAHRMLSRGEGKLLVYAIALAQVRQVASLSQRTPLLLLDDLPAELDEANRRRFLEQVGRTGEMQVFVTSIEQPDWQREIGAGVEVAMFHVEQASAQPVLQ